MSTLTEAAAWMSDQGEDICICGIGARTAVGLGAEATAAAVRGNISGLGVHPFFVDQDDEPVSFAADAAIEADVPITQRMQFMLQSVTAEVLGQVHTTPTDIDNCWLALPEKRSGLPANFESLLASVFTENLHFAPEAVRILADGHAAGLMALQAAAQSLSRGEIETALVIGVDSYHDLRTIQSLDARRRLMAGRNPGGFPPGEAAGACLVLRSDSAARRGLPVLATIRSAATAIEPHPLRSSDPCLGEGLTAAVTAVAGSLRIPQELITATYCDLNGERYRSEEFGFALLRIQHAFADAHAYISPADCWGDVGAASGPLFAVLAIASGLRGYAKGSHPLLWAGSDSGHRSAVLLRLGNPEEVPRS